MKRCILFLLLLSLAGCDNEARKLRRLDEVKNLIHRYVEVLPKAYETGNISALDGFASEREKSTVRTMVQTLRAKNYRLKASLADLQITYTDIFNESNAYVRTTETWDVTSYRVDTGEVRGHQRGQVLHVVYQVKEFQGEGWLVIARIVQETKQPFLKE
ncbi:MAG TPA: hypothetical protein PK014_09170 [Thermoanaerobaculia bacterium]|nr:hypothetical protein [Thermoanaerobaculia bacterium]HUM30356.1 hypothetical protein [Thermoanaerobaculia bacterium]HXK68493.1 hypothetical protein [Thermoanaerobaculia bacterium]